MIIIYNHIIGATSTLDTLAPFLFYMRDSFIIYRSFYEAICDLDADSQAQVFKAICEYSLNFTEIELTGIAKTIFKLIKPQLDANNKRFENGKQPKTKPEISKTEAKRKQKESKIEANNNVNDNVNVNNNFNLNDNVNKIPTLEEFGKYAIEHKPNADKQDVKLKYEAWVQNGWKDGKNNKIINWKSKLLQTLPHIKEAVITTPKNRSVAL